ncbi:MAG: LptA/OstA family protein [Treponema sp.]|jgi:lipopolysaccharide export system protein LptA|nr:LptA/OstA family protein [Treponema sp.]
MKIPAPSYFVSLLLFLIPALPLLGENFSFKADHMSGSRASGREMLVLSGHAEVHSDNLLLKADRIEIQGKNNEFIDCAGNVWGRDEEKDIIFQSDRLRYDRTLKIARLEGNSTLEDRQNEVVAKGRFIEYNDKTETAVFQAAVRLFKESIVCRAEYAVYRRDAQTLELSGFPVVFKKEDQFRAERIRVDLDTEDVSMEGDVSGLIKDEKK